MERFWLIDPYARAYRVGPKQNVFMEESGLRVQRDSSSRVLLQWRVKSKASSNGSGIIAYGSLSKSEALSLSDYLADVARELTDD